MLVSMVMMLKRTMVMVQLPCRHVILIAIRTSKYSMIYQFTVLLGDDVEEDHGDGSVALSSRNFDSYSHQ
jgi:hypothetical protein